MKTTNLKTGILATAMMMSAAHSAQAFTGTDLLVQSLIAINVIDAASINQKLKKANTLLTQQIDVTNQFWKLPVNQRTLEREAELRAALKGIVIEATQAISEEKAATLKEANYVEQRIVLPVIAEMEAELRQIDSWITNGAYFSAQKKAIALRKDVAAAQATLK